MFLLQRRTLKDGSSVEPVLCKSGPVHQAFLKPYIDRDSQEIHIYYQGLVFTGKGTMPKELNSDAAVVAYVTRAKGAIGYVGGLTNTEGVKVLAVISEESKGERTLVKRVDQTTRKRCSDLASVEAYAWNSPSHPRVPSKASRSLAAIRS